MNINRITKAFTYLDKLRESGRTNMWGAATYLEREAGFEAADARWLTGKWMDTFGDEAPADRAATVTDNPPAT